MHSSRVPNDSNNAANRTAPIPCTRLKATQYAFESPMVAPFNRRKDGRDYHADSASVKQPSRADRYVPDPRGRQAQSRPASNRADEAGMTGFEPAVSALTGQRVGPLHHTPDNAQSTMGRVRPSRNAACSEASVVCRQPSPTPALPGTAISPDHGEVCSSNDYVLTLTRTRLNASIVAATPSSSIQ